MRPHKLNDQQITAALATLPAWELRDGGQIIRRLTCPDFVSAFALLTAVALTAEKMNHHPAIFNVYNRLEFTLSTHDAGGLTELDFTLARHIDSLAARMVSA